MTIARPAHSPWQITCDKCRNTAEQPHNLHFKQVLAAIRDLGWKSIKRFSKWAHHCPKCTAPKVDVNAIAERWL